MSRDRAGLKHTLKGHGMNGSSRTLSSEVTPAPQAQQLKRNVCVCVGDTEAHPAPWAELLVVKVVLHISSFEDSVHGAR